MRARPSDPVAVLRDAAFSLPRGNEGSRWLRALAGEVSIRPSSLREAIERLGMAVNNPEWTPDERAAFALAREALSTLDAAKETR